MAAQRRRATSAQNSTTQSPRPERYAIRRAGAWARRHEGSVAAGSRNMYPPTEWLVDMAFASVPEHAIYLYELA